jgi:hypothetical protein
MLSTKQKLRKEADRLWKEAVIENKPICEVCGKERTETGHHFFPKGLFGHLRFEVENGIAIGRSCHFSHHHKGDPRIHAQIIKNRGEKWYNELLIRSRENPSSYQTISFYKKTIEELKKRS